jgi:glycogen debranching enzyme
VKGDLVGSIVHQAGAPVANPDFAVASVGFAALVAFNARELADRFGVTFAGDLGAIVDGLTARWDDQRGTWIDVTLEGPASSSTVRTADALLPLLVTEPTAASADAAWATIMDARAVAGEYGPRGVDRREPTYRPDQYWRGPCWPQLGYLLWLAARGHDRPIEATALAETTRQGAIRSGLAEYWNADTGAGLGAIPQSWAGIALLFEATA